MKRTRENQTKVGDELAVCGTAFGIASLTFFLAVLLLIPSTAHLSQRLQLPDLVTVSIILLELFALPIAAAIWGIAIAVSPSRH